MLKILFSALMPPRAEKPAKLRGLLLNGLSGSGMGALAHGTNAHKSHAWYTSSGFRSRSLLKCLKSGLLNPAWDEPLLIEQSSSYAQCHLVISAMTLFSVPGFVNILLYKPSSSTSLKAIQGFGPVRFQQASAIKCNYTNLSAFSRPLRQLSRG